MTESVSRCVLGEWCAQSVPDESGHRSAAVRLGTGPMCYSDMVRTEKLLRSLPWLYDQLRETLEKSGTASGPSRAKSIEPPIPIRLDTEELMSALVAGILLWEDDIRKATGATRRDPHLVRNARPSVLVQRIAPWLATRVVEMAEVSDGGHVLALIDLDDRFRGLLGLKPKHQNLLGPCRACGMRRLVRWDGGAGLEDRVTCLECGTEYTPAEYSELINESTIGGAA